MISLTFSYGFWFFEAHSFIRIFRIKKTRVDWFKTIKDFYLSIQEELLNKGLRFAQEHIDIFGKDREIA